MLRLRNCRFARRNLGARIPSCVSALRADAITGHKGNGNFLANIACGRTAHPDDFTDHRKCHEESMPLPHSMRVQGTSFFLEASGSPRVQGPALETGSPSRIRAAIVALNPGSGGYSSRCRAQQRMTARISPACRPLARFSPLPSTARAAAQTDALSRRYLTPHPLSPSLWNTGADTMNVIETAKKARGWDEN
jgi:hypothetical protein